MDVPIKEAARLLKSSKKAIALTGAGVSTESGIPDFRSQGGLWSRFDPVKYGTLSAFKRNPVEVWKMLAELISIADARPNQGHLIMAEFEQKNIIKGIITQNIDMLHFKGGSKNVIEFHGAISSLTCLGCKTQFPLSALDKKTIPPPCPHCQSLLKPDVVFFDEQIPEEVIEKSRDLMRGVDCLLVAGTSCSVMPASFFPQQVLDQGGTIIELNLEPTLGHRATVVLRAGFSKTMQLLQKEIEDHT